MAAQTPRGDSGNHGRDLGWMPFGWGFAPGTSGPFFGRARAGRGDIRTGILFLLSEQPMHGYQLIQELTERSGGFWRPSSGSVYPALQKLEDEGLVRSREADGRRVFELAEVGKAEVGRRKDEPPPWDMGEVNDPLAVIRDEFYGVVAAAMHVAQAGGPEELARGKRILAEASKRLYRLLAEDE
jgi:DNA-binding PadR family transcriptional regulator